MYINGTAKHWKEVITPRNNLFYLNLKELWGYRDLLLILVKRDITALYKQTILGPLWFFLQPILTTIVFVLVFSRAGKLPTLGLPPVLFYLSGIVLWSYFAECVIKTSTFFKDNSAVLSKVYFPRIIIPLSLVVTNLIKFFIQFLLFVLVLAFFMLTTKLIATNFISLLLPFLILMIALLGCGTGLIISSLTVRYKDLIHLITLGIQLMMFASPVIFPLSSFGSGYGRFIIMANPMTGIIEAFRFGFLGKGMLDWGLLSYDLLFVCISLLIGLVSFNATEKSFVDSI